MWLGLLTVNTITSVLMINLNVKTHISVTITIFEHLSCACKPSDNTPSYIHVLARKHVQYQHSNIFVDTVLTILLSY